MNQQRARRFRSAQEAEDAVKQAKAKGQYDESKSDEDKFDSNCITPGTPFMCRLQAHLEYFVRIKLSTDPAWKKVKVVLDGHQCALRCLVVREPQTLLPPRVCRIFFAALSASARWAFFLGASSSCARADCLLLPLTMPPQKHYHPPSPGPGEGEHKIMDYIRMLKSQPGYDKYTRHCMYGLDADLMILGLLSHEPYFFLLREEVKFGGRSNTKREASAASKTWHLLSLTLFRDYIKAEFSSVETGISFEYDFERLLDDWVLLGYFVGNDFLPHLPDFHIGEDIKPWIYQCYREVIVTLDGWISDGGIINMPRLQKLLDGMANFDLARFSETYADLKLFGGSTGGKGGKGGKKKGGGGGGGKTPDWNCPSCGAMCYGSKSSCFKCGVSKVMEAIPDSGGDTSSAGLIATMFGAPAPPDDDGDGDGESVFELEFKQHKRLYYSSKLGIEDPDDDFVQSIAKEYVRGLQWVLLYYYKGTPAWGWSYLHHYAPYVSDLKGISDFVPEFEVGEPFLPFQQLMSVLPPASRHGMVPEAFQPLMVDPESPILDFYPLEFESDLNGKKQDWEALVLICFIDEVRLRAAMGPIEHLLTAEEKSRNIRTTPIEIVYDNAHPAFYSAPKVGRSNFPDIQASCVRIKSLPWPHSPIDRDHIGLCDGVDLDSIYMVGYPALRHIPFRHSLRKGCVKVFDNPTRNDSVILTPLEVSPAKLEDADASCLGQSVWVEWPHLREALAVAISIQSGRISYHAGKKQAQTSQHTPQQQKMWKQMAQTGKQTFLEKFGVDTGDVQMMIHVRKLTDVTPAYGKDGKITMSKKWDVQEIAFPYQLVVRKLEVIDPQASRAATVVEKFAPGAQLVHLGTLYRGCVGEVLRVDPKTFLLDIKITAGAIPPNMKTIVSSFGPNQRGASGYVPSHQAAKAARISGRLLGRLLGSLYIFKPQTGNGTMPVIVVPNRPEAREPRCLLMFQNYVSRRV